MFPRMSMNDGSDRGSAHTPLQELIEVIDVAADLADKLVRDPMLERLVEAFRLMPLEDRGTLIGAIEREVHARRLSRATEGVTGQAMHANPHARLYVRSHETAVPRQLLEREELMLAMLSALRLAPILLIPEIHGQWIDGSREATSHLDAATRAGVGQLLRELLAVVESESIATRASDRAAHAS